MKKRILFSMLVVLLLAIIGGAIYINSLMPIITGYAAKNLCSAVFVSGRFPIEVEAKDLNFSFIKLNENTVNYEKKSVTSRFLWGKSTAIYRAGFGCTLLRGVDETKFQNITFPELPELAYDPAVTEWPLGDVVPGINTGINRQELDHISKKIIDEDAYQGTAYAFLVLHQGIPVVERYKPQFNEKTRFLGWSMTKSITNALIGILVKDGIWDINQPVDLPEWRDDARKSITLKNLMQMQSGLQWNENYGNRSDVTVMLHCENDFAKFAYSQPLKYPVGSHWYYSSGTTNIVTHLMRQKFADDAEFYTFPFTRLFHKIGITNAVLEPDPSGNPVGSSYLYATARDYARFALLYLQDGIFNGERILPEGWVNYSATPAENSDGRYGAFFWLNRDTHYPSAPEDMFSCQGHDGQQIFIIPSKELAVVVLGYSPKPVGMNFNALLGDVLATLK
ncbi:serine hydrolase [bacterium]|nr:serine hydrolase [bacterium]